ncbi:MAG TPA: glycosyltransferase, partial [Candidatus Nitrosotalea sp.]|nr:glycosyltransferase [Candidatus Nitrosotalea sp.]
MTASRAPVRFSLMLPVFNEAARLPAILESIRRQRYPADFVELLVADGGSTDETAAIARAFGARVYDNPVRRAEPGAGMLL